MIPSISPRSQYWNLKREVKCMKHEIVSYKLGIYQEMMAGTDSGPYNDHCHLFDQKMRIKMVSLRERVSEFSLTYGNSGVSSKKWVDLSQKIDRLGVHLDQMYEPWSFREVGFWAWCM